MSLESMTTTFVDTQTGEEYEFLGTSIQFSERALLALEAEHDHEIELFVENLIESGYFDEEWDDDKNGDEENLNPAVQKDEVERKPAPAPVLALAPTRQNRDDEDEDEDSEHETSEESESLLSLSDANSLSSCNEDTSDDDAYTSCEDKENEFLIHHSNVSVTGFKTNVLKSMEKFPFAPSTRISAKAASLFARPLTMSRLQM